MISKKTLRENKIIGLPYRIASTSLTISKGVFKLWMPLLFRKPQMVRFIPEWFVSFFPGQAAFEKGTPWITFEAVEWLNSYLTKEMNVFEWGSGGSTIFFAKKAKSHVAVEHNPKWYNLITQRFKKDNIVNCRYFLQEPERGENAYSSSVAMYRGLNFEKYCKTIESYPDDYFDLIFLDGRVRNICAQKAVSKLKKGGFLMLDDSDTPVYASISEFLKDWLRKDFYGPKRTATISYQATLWQKPIL